MEPDYAANSLKNITFRRCLAANNTACGFSMSPHNLLRSLPGEPPKLTAAVDVSFEDCTTDSFGQLDAQQCKAQDGCGWSVRAGYSLSGFPPNITGSVRFLNCSAIGGTGPALQMDSKAAAMLTTFTDCSFSNVAPATGAATSVITMEPSASGKFEKLYGQYAYGGVVFRNCSVGLTAEDPTYRRAGHSRSWMTVVSKYGLVELDTSGVKVVAEPGSVSGGCKKTKIERAGAYQPWKDVNLNFSCRGSGL